MTVEEYLKAKKAKQAQEAAKAASASAVPQEQPSQGPNYQDILGEKLGFLQEDPHYRESSIIPDWQTGNGIVDFLGNNLVNPVVKPIEQFARIIPAVGYEGARAVDATMQVPGWEQRAQRENPFVPGVESATQGQNAAMIGKRTLKTMFDVATLGKGSSILKGGKIAMSQLPRLAAEGFALGAGQSMTGREAPTVGEVGASGVAGAVLNPVASIAMHEAGQLARKLLGRPQMEAAQEAINNAVSETALVKTPTPLELAEQRMKQRMQEVQSKDISGGLPIGSRNANGAIEVPPGGFTPFQAEGTQDLRKPMEGFVMDNMNEATNMLESILGKKKTAALKRQYIEGIVQEPFPEPGRILQKPVDMRPQPVLGKYSIEKPFETDMPAEVQTMIDVLSPIKDNVVPAHVPTAIEHIPVEQRDPSTLQVLARNLWQPMQQSVEKFGPTGKALAKKIDDFRAQEYITRGKTQTNVIDPAFKNLKLTEDEANNFWEAAQGLAAPMNDKVAGAAQASKVLAKYFFNENTKRGILENMVDNSGSPIIDPENYLSHMFNQKGWDEHQFNPEKFFRKIAEHNLKPGDDIEEMVRNVRADWKFIQANMTPKSFFERKRTWRIPPEWMEKDPQKIWSRYNASASKRYALLDHFGAPFEDMGEDGARKLNYPALKQMIGGIGQEAGMDAQRYTDNMMDLIIGRAPSDFQMKKVVADLQEAQLISKLGPLSTVQNLSQGFLGSIYQHGVKNAIKGVTQGLSKEGGEWARKTGLIGEGFYNTPHNSKMMKLWKNISHFSLSEDINFRIVTNSARDFLKDMYPKLVNNPANQAVRKHFELHGLDPEKILAQGALTEDDLLKGSFIAARDTVFPRMVEQAVQWSNNPVGKLMYQFMHYQLKQPEMLAKQFKVSKTRGLTSLAKYLAASAVTGEVSADMWALIKGRERPEDPIPRALDNIISAGGFGLPGEALRTMKEGYGDLFRPGPLAGGIEKTAMRAGSDISHGDVGKLMEDLLRAKVRGDLPIGPPIPAGANIEAFFPRKPINSKEKGGMSGPKSFDTMRAKGFKGFSSP